MFRRNAVFFSSLGFFSEVKAPFFEFRSWQGQRDERDPEAHDTLYLTFAGAEQSAKRLGRGGWRARSCDNVPFASATRSSEHGRRSKQAHDENHDWIPIRRGICNRCQKTFTFLPPFSPPYCHYSLIARSQALRRYFLEGHQWEAAAPAVKDPDRVADASTLRRWFRSLDSSLPPFSHLRRTMLSISAWLGRTEVLVHDSLPLRWPPLKPSSSSCPLRLPRKEPSAIRPGSAPCRVRLRRIALDGAPMRCLTSDNRIQKIPREKGCQARSGMGA